MSEHAATPPGCGPAPEPALDAQMLCALLLHPETTEEALERAARRRRRRAALTVVATSGLTLAPAVSLAEDSPPSPPIVSATCQISDQLPDGTPSGVLTDGSVCVQPVAVPDPQPEPAAPAAEPAADAPAAAVAPADDPPAAPAAPATVAEPAQDAESAAETAAAAEPSPAPAESTPAQVQSGGPAAVPARPRAKPAATAGASKRSRARTARGERTRRDKPSALRRIADPPPAAAAVPTVVADALPGGGQGPLASPFFVTDEPVIPRFLIDLYKKAGRRYHIPWPILAAINEIETDFGRNVAVSSAGATGWMQFMPQTWSAYGVDADHDGVKDPNNPRDAIFAAGRYLKASGAQHNMRRAIFAYNHAGWYVDSVLLRAERIASHQGERNRRLDRLFRAGEQRLEQQVLADPRITLYECGRQDIEAHRIDRRVLIALRFLAWSGLHPTVSSLECGHGVYTSSGNVSEHSTGSAVDISAINGIPIFGNQGSGSVTEATIRELLTLRGAMTPHQIISLMSFEAAGNTVAMGDHYDHIHIGFQPLEPLSP